MLQLLKYFSLSLIFLFILSVSYAITPGTYVGLNAGETALSLPDTNLNKSADFGGRAYAGYNFNEYLGVEAGVAHYGNAKYKSFEYNTNALDIVAKTYLPFGEKRFNIFALGGIAAVNSITKANHNEEISINDFVPNSKTRIRPIYGAGVGYDIPKSHFTATIEVTRIQGVGDLKSSPHSMPSANMVSVGLTYNFD